MKIHARYQRWKGLFDNIKLHVLHVGGLYFVQKTPRAVARIIANDLEYYNKE